MFCSFLVVHISWFFPWTFDHVAVWDVEGSISTRPPKVYRQTILSIFCVARNQLWCVQWHLNRKNFSNRGFRWSCPFPWDSSKIKLAYCQGVYGGTRFQEFVCVQSSKSSFQRVCTMASLQEKYFKSRFHMVSSTLGTHQKVNLHSARVFTGARCFRSLYVFRVPNHHSKECTGGSSLRKKLTRWCEKICR